MIVQQMEYKANPAPDMPDGYMVFEEGKWLTNDTWQCLAIRPDAAKVGIPYEYSIKVLTIYVIGSGSGYTVHPLYAIDGTTSKIPYDGNAWG